MKLMISPSDPCEHIFHNLQPITTESTLEYLLKVHVARRYSVSGTCKTTIDMFISILKLYNFNVCVRKAAFLRKTFFFLVLLRTMVF